MEYSHVLLYNVNICMLDTELTQSVSDLLSGQIRRVRLGFQLYPCKVRPYEVAFVSSIKSRSLFTNWQSR